MRLRDRILRTAGTNTMFVTMLMVSALLTKALLVPHLIRNGHIVQTWDFYANMK